MSTPEVRQRKKASEPSPSPPKSASTLLKEEDTSRFSLLDAFRLLTFVVLVSSALSYFVTRNSVVWNLSLPNFTRLSVLKSWLNGPIQYTDADLRFYDGTDPTKPILLAINGTIYDVSNGRKHYGPGGSYHLFAGADASRGFVTGCFDTDRTPDMRGVEEMFLPKDDPEIDGLYSSAQMKILREQEKRKAKIETYNALKHWVDFFANSKKYTKVGQVKREKGWETKGPAPTLCARAQEGRSVRARPEGK
ncbi:cytochrome b5 [Hyaloscypha variabilis]